MTHQPDSLPDQDGVEAGADPGSGSPEPAGEGALDDAEWLADPEYRAAVVDLFGALAYGELTAFERLAEDAALAPGVPDTAALGRMAVAELGHYRRLATALAGLGSDPYAAMEPFVEPLEAFHERTRPSNWLEGLVKAYVGDGIAVDFYREVSAFLDGGSRALVHEVLVDTGHARFVVETVRAAVRSNPALGGRLALWARRLVGEALSQAQRVAAERDALAGLLVGGANRPGTDLAEFGRMLARMTEAHNKRMASLGLSA